MSNQSNNKRLYLVLGGICLLLIVFLVLMSNRNSSKYKWYETYEIEDEQPYGLSYFKTLLDDYSDDFEVRNVGLRLDSFLSTLSTDTHYNYMFIGNNLLSDYADCDSLLSFIKRGNTAFISSRNFAQPMMEELFYVDYYFNNVLDAYEDSSATLSFNHQMIDIDSGLVLKHQYIDKVSSRQWHYFDTALLTDNYYPTAKLGYTDSLHQINFVKVNIGEGSILLHTEPLVFSNYHLQNKAVKRYVEGVLNHLDEGVILWDEYNKQYHYREPGNGSGNKIAGPSPLNFMLEQPPLAWAFWVGLSLVGIFFVFRSKRRQRMMPITEPNINTSMEFINTIGRLYFLKQNHKQLASVKMKLFLRFVKERYGIQLSTVEEVGINRLIERSQVDEQEVNAIFKSYNAIKNQESVMEDALIYFHNHLDNFYKKCK